MTNQGTYPYSFRGAERLGFGFLDDSPTPTGLFLVFVALAGVAYLTTNNGSVSVRSKVVVLITYVATVVGVALTYSRGAMMALFCSLALSVLFFGRGTRRWALLIYLTTACIFILVPNGARRIQSTFDVNEDKSIKNRLELWKGTCYSIVQHFPAAVGAYRTGQEYEKYWQPLESRHNYKTPINLWLTIYAFGGPFVFFGIVFFYFSFIVSSFIGAYCNHMSACLYSFLGLIAFGIGNFFSTVIQIPVLIIFLISCAIPLIYFANVRSHLIPASKNVFKLGIIIVAISCLLLLMPFFVRMIYPERISHNLQNITLSNGDSAQVECFGTSDSAKIEKIVVVFSNLKDAETDIISGRFARAFCDRGYATCVVDMSNSLTRLAPALRLSSCREVLFLGISEACLPLLKQIAEMVPKNSKIRGLGLILPPEVPSVYDIKALAEIPIAVLADTTEEAIERMRFFHVFKATHVWTLIQREPELQETVFSNKFISILGEHPQ